LLGLGARPCIAGQTTVDLPMLWTSLRWNWGNTLAVAAFCLLLMLGAVNNGFVFDDRDGAGPDNTIACVGLCDKDQQPAIGATRADVAPAATALLQSQAFATD
jgi:hypothetical protein